METIPLVECRNLTLILHNQLLLDNISFTLYPGEDLVVYGPNGAGKTLLLSVLSGNLEPTAGSVHIFGKPLYAKDSYTIKKQIGFVSPKLFDDYDFNSKVTDIVMSGLFGSIGVASDPAKHNNRAVRDYINRVIAQKHKGLDLARALLETLNVEYVLNEEFGHLSYGEKVRVLIARSLINNPPLFILDEPTTGLDLPMRAKFAKVITQLTKSSEIIYVTHHIEEIPVAFAKILLLKEGKVFEFGDKKDMLTSKMLSVLFTVDVTVHQENGKYFVLF